MECSKIASSSVSSTRQCNETDFDDLYSTEIDDDRNLSDEDTEDASETDAAKQETQYTEIKEQMYQDKLAHLKKQLQQLEDGTLPEYIKRNKKIEQQHKERQRLNEIWMEYEMAIIEREYIKEKKQSVIEFEERKVELREILIYDLEDKRRNIDIERNTMELTGDSMEVKPASTRKLRRRPNDPIPIPEKRRKLTPAQINFALDEEDIFYDLRIINKVSGKPVNRKPLPPPSPIEGLADVKIDDGRLYYDKRWFHRNQPVFVESRDNGKFSGVITAIGTNEIWIRKTSDNSKMRVYLSQLQKGKFMLRRRQS
ncbi:hypothetical protein CHS0354_025334 [Potamilus streckersoni]|uniref:Sin3 histone deacetylase corepressor complex component SDS3 n=1 Tax=Potamilus streckersoni TaxID=2493646 RepID=A0AAE0W085_9BIVA|nr:hypothetical protein CHS0354_025334 [Potamilus streckersoni]